MERNVRGLAPLLGLLMIAAAWGTAMAAPAPDPVPVPPEAQDLQAQAAAAIQDAQQALADAAAGADGTQQQLLAAASEAAAQAQQALDAAQAGAGENLGIASDQAMAAMALAMALAEAAATEADREVQAKLAEARQALAEASVQVAELQGMAVAEGCARLGEALMSGPYRFWTSCNMGPGSGLDADTLDGLSSGDILLSVEQEAIARRMADDLLRAGLDGERADRIARDLVLRGGLDDEAAARVAEDSLLAARIAGEGAARAALDAGLEDRAWQAALARDGPLSGLDADTLDGLDGAQLVRSDAPGSIDGTLHVLGNGNVGIGTDQASQRLSVDGVTRTDVLYIGDQSFTDRVPGNNWDNLIIRQPVRTGGGLWGVNVEIADEAAHTAGFYPYWYRDLAGDGDGTLFNVHKDGGLYAAGNVGIGTTARTEMLTVAGTVQSTSGGFKFPDGSLQTTAASNGIGGSGTPGAVPRFTAGNQLADSVMVQAGNGNLGIGTTSPLGKLNVLGTTGDIRLQADETPFAGTVLLGAAYARSANGAQWRLGNTVAGVDIGQNANHDFVVEAPVDMPRVVVQRSNGNMGVGTMSPAEKLSVAGTIQSTSGGFRFPDGTLQATAAAPGVGGAGTTGRLARFTAGNALGDSIVTEASGRLGVGAAAPPSAKVGIGGSQAHAPASGRYDAAMLELAGTLSAPSGQGYLWGMRVAPTYDVTQGYLNWLSGVHVEPATRVGSQKVHTMASFSTYQPTGGQCTAAFGVNMDGHNTAVCNGAYGFFQGPGSTPPQYNSFAANTGIGTPFPTEKLEVNGGLKLQNASLGGCSASNAGTMKYVAGASGVADTLQMCLKSAANTYAWKAVVTG